MSNTPSPEMLSKRSLRLRRSVLIVFIALVFIIPFLFVVVFTDFGRWTAQWQVWWGLRQAEATAVTQATVISFYKEDEDAFILYRYTASDGQQYEKTEQVKNSIWQKAEAGEPIMVDFAVDDPSIVGIAGNNDPFNRLTAIVVMVGLIMLRLAGRRPSSTSSLIKRVSALDAASEAPPIPSQKRPMHWTRLELILIILLVLIVQFILLFLFLTR